VIYEIYIQVFTDTFVSFISQIVLFDFPKGKSDCSRGISSKIASCFSLPPETSNCVLTSITCEFLFIVQVFNI